jgi:glycosyltransferase involved in cell wall biosynthesis
MHVLGSAAPAGASIAGMVRAIAHGLDPEQYRLSACFLGDSGPWSSLLQRSGLRVVEARWLNPLDVAGALGFWRALRSQPVDLLHVHYGGRSVRAVARAATVAPLLVHLHGRVRTEDDPRPIRMRLPDADAIVATSRAVAAAVEGRSVRVIYPGVPMTNSAGPRDSCTIGAAGRLVPIKGYDRLIRALADVRHGYPQAQLEIAGEGPLRAELEQVARSIGLAHAVHFLGWSNDLPELMGRWTVLAQPSREEALGITVLQAMAAGLPVVASAVGGIPEIIEDRVTGRLVRDESDGSLARALTELLTDPVARAGYSEAGRARASDFSEPRFVAGIAEVYGELLHARTDRRQGTG